MMLLNNCLNDCQTKPIPFGFQTCTIYPIKSQGALANCTFLKEEDRKQVIAGNYIKTKKFLYTHIDQGITEKQERIFLLSPSKKDVITIEFNYRPCEKR